jgi:hypothetical protein
MQIRIGLNAMIFDETATLYTQLLEGKKEP